MAPTRIQRERVKGFNLQEESMKLNGLPAVSCTRPGKWSNPYRISGQKGHWFVIDNGEPIVTFDERKDAVECSLELFREYIAHEVNRGKVNLQELKGKNLSCFCKPSDPCHTDYLLEIANK